MENPSGNVRLDSGAFLILTELFERANQIVAYVQLLGRLTGALYSACADANW